MHGATAGANAELEKLADFGLSAKKPATAAGNPEMTNLQGGQLNKKPGGIVQSNAQKHLKMASHDYQSSKVVYKHREFVREKLVYFQNQLVHQLGLKNQKDKGLDFIA